MMDVHSIETGGRRCIHVAPYSLNPNDSDPEHRVMLSSGWVDDPALPVAGRCITLPLSALPALIAALQGIREP